MKKEKKEAIEMLSKKYLEMSDQYKRILTWAGIEEEQIPKLCSVMNVMELTGVTLDGILEVNDRKSHHRILVYGWRGKKYLEDDIYERVRMGKKAVYLNELDSDEVKRAVAGFYVATCMSLLVIYMVK